ncbi:transcription antitermination factor NusB [Ferrovum sp.]|jgi:N utilization substance protein B|uniref:transcription antitermination factor NusB n=1 Tax=Ferrovum sp. TaxID=2609467 RepID=UPI002637BD98|nr:transcription antitermination factor NusB [Ferrovum sp.]
MKSARRQARELVVQGLYEWQLADTERAAIIDHLGTQPHFMRADREFLEQLLKGVMTERTSLDQRLGALIDRPLTQVSPVERAILWLASYELAHFPETPFRVILNEAIDLAKRFGGTDGHKYINGVLDRLVAQERPEERQHPVRQKTS